MWAAPVPGQQVVRVGRGLASPNASARESSQSKAKEWEAALCRQWWFIGYQGMKGGAQVGSPVKAGVVASV